MEKKDFPTQIKNEFQESEKLFRILAETAASAIFIYQSEKICYANPATKNITGYSQKDLSTLKFWDLAHPDFREFIKGRGLARLRGEQMPSRYETKILTKNGEERWIDVAAASINFKNQPAVLVTAFDITEKKKAEQALLESESRYRAIVEDQSEWICRFSNNGDLIFANKAFCNYFMKNQDNAAGCNFSIFIPENDRLWTMQRIASLKKEDPLLIHEHKALTTDGQIRWQKWTTRALFDFNKQLTEYQSVGRDITERKQAEENLRSLALVDELTGLYNRRGFFTLVEQELKIANRLKKEMLLLYADVDDLKLINDTYGHHEGDIVLMDTANILKDTFRESDIIARIGGDEFVVLALQTDNTNTEFLRIRLQNNIESYNATIKKRLRISISMGIVSYLPESPRTIHNLLREADALMYEQKQKK